MLFAGYQSLVCRIKRLHAEGSLARKIGIRIRKALLRLPLIVPAYEYVLLNLLARRINRADRSRVYCQVLTLYKRNTLLLQIHALLRQTLLPSKVIIYQNSSISRRPWMPRGQNVILYTHNTNWNAKYHGRFYACLPVESDYYVLWDDDIGPGPLWNERCLNYVQSHDCIVTANGRGLIPDSVRNLVSDYQRYLHTPYELRLGDGLPIASDTVVDYGGHSWAFARSSLIDMASIDPPSLANSEDFHLSAASFVRSGTQTVVLSQDAKDADGYPDLFMNYYSVDAHASHKVATGNFMLERATIILKWIDCYGYIPVAERSRDR